MFLLDPGAFAHLIDYIGFNPHLSEMLNIRRTEFGSGCPPVKFLKK